MVNMQRGFKSKLDAGGIDVGQPIQVWTSVNGNSQYDLSCFALDENDKVVDERYVIFYNELESPNGEITLVSNGSRDITFHVNLALLPSQIYKLCFTVTIDGKGLMRDINTCAVRIMQNGQTAFSFDITGSHFQSQKAIITIEIYNKNGWRVAAVASGYNFSGGLDELMAHYGVNVGEPKPEPKLPPSKPKPPSEPKPSLPPVVNNGPVSGKNVEGFDRNDDDWV